ncbi:MAG: cobalamin-dependent protein [Planctomycetaceae bacterium]|nr:cobalamin-dependent protein [Planctomycetaceae bacterium]
MSSETLVSPKQVARAVGVSESSLKRWCDQGLIPTVKTAGGHRRMPISGVMQFLRSTGQTLVRPEELGLPSGSGEAKRAIGDAAGDIARALIGGNEAVARRIVTDLYVAGHSATELCDRILAPAFEQVGKEWECGAAEVYQERWACESCERILNELRALIVASEESGPMACGGALEGDYYTVPTRMAELTLREAGWRATSLGSNLPAATLAAAIRTLRPRLFWISVSYIPVLERFQDALKTLQQTAASRTTLVLGGRALTADVTRDLGEIVVLQGMQPLRAFATALIRKKK